MSVSARVAVRAPDLLARFNRADLLSAADVQVARRLGALCQENDESVLLAAALAVRELRAGSVCLLLEDRETMLVPTTEDTATGEARAEPAPTDADLPDAARWREAIAASPMVAATDDAAELANRARPLRLRGSRLYLDRYWRDENVVRHFVTSALAAPVSDVDPLRVGDAVRQVFGDDPGLSQQRIAAATAAFSRFTVLTGGPGTGKTTAVTGVLAVLHRLFGPGLDVALGAPTGKAAARLSEAVAEQIAELSRADHDRVGTVTAATLHRVLGNRMGTQVRFQHDRSNPLRHDVVVIDESSMLALPLMARLVEALHPTARLVLVGDADQLASVDAGAVLGDLVARPAPSAALAAAVEQAVPEDVAAAGPERTAANVVRLHHRWRFGGVIGDLADAVRDGDEDQAVALLTSGDPALDFVEVSGDSWDTARLNGLRSDVQSAGLAMLTAAHRGDAATALEALGKHRLLLAHRRGPYGVAQWAAQVERWIDEADVAHPSPARSLWTAGRPVLVGVNDPASGLFNGDTGVLINQDGAEFGSVVAVFGGRRDPLFVALHRLPAVETVHAMTVHKAQGSQFDAVTVLLPPPTSPLLTRELFYTGITRARHRVRVVASIEAVRVAVRRRVRRASGLREL